MASVGELSVDVKARINDFSKNLSQAIGQANIFATRMSQVGKKDYFAPVQETLSGMSRDFKQIIQGIVLAQTFYSGLQLFKQLTSAVYEYTDALNYAQVTFSNLFRDASLGEEFVAVLQQYAARSPFDFTDIEKGARQLSAYGVQAKNLMYVMEGIGNLSAVTGDPQTFETVSRAMGQIYSKGRLSAEEMRQLAEAGLNVKEVYARLGIEAGNVGKANVDAATALNTIVEVLNDTYAGAMDAANTTMRGMLANTKDVLLSVSSAVFQLAYEKLQRVLKWIQIGLDDFQAAFSTDGLASAIEKVFGADALNRIQQFLAICQYLGNVLYQLLAPAFRIVGMYGQTFLTVFGSLIRVFGPVVELFAALLNSFLNTTAGARMLQSALMGLVVIKMVGGLASLLTNSFALVSKALVGVISVASAASSALTILTGAEVGAAQGAYGAAAAWRYFTKTLNVNPIVMALTIILSLIAAIAGLRAMLGQTTDALADMSGVDFKKFFEGIKQATGDAEKFKKPFEDAGDAIDDANGELDKTKKKLEGLLSFDEVFKLPERNDTDPTGKGDASSDDVFEPGDWGAIELPEVEPLDPRDLFPDINGILTWFKDQPWWKIGQYIANGIASGLKMAKTVPSKAVTDFIDDLLDTAGKRLDKFNIKEKIINLAEKAKESRDTFKGVGKQIGDDLYKALEKELGPEKAEKLKLKERLEKVAKEAAKGETAWKEAGQKLARSLEEDLAKELGPEKASKYGISKQLEKVATEAEKANVKFAKAGKDLAEELTGSISKYLGPEATKELKIAENLDKIIKDAVEGGKAWEEGGRTSARNWLDGLNKEFEKASIKGKAPEKAMVSLAKELKAAGVAVTDAGVELSDDFIKKLGQGLEDKKSFGEIAKDFAKNFVDAFKSLPKNISEALGKSFTPSAIFAGIKKSFTTKSGESIFKSFTSAIKGAFSPAKIGEFLKTGLKDMGITIIGEMLFEELSNWFDNNGLHEASVVADKAGPIIASGFGTAIATKSPWGFVVGALWGALFEDLGKGLENGDWSSFINQSVGSLGVVLNKLAPKIAARLGTGGGAAGPIGWAGAIGSAISDVIFGSIIQNLRDSGDTHTADLLDGIDGAVGGALAGAGLGATIGSIFPVIGTSIGAIAGAIIGALAGFLTDNWSAVSEWWNNTAVPWLQDLPGKIVKFFVNASTWLYQTGKDILDGLSKGIKAVWTSVSNWFKNIGTNIIKFFIKASTWLVTSGKDILIGLWDGIKDWFGTLKDKFVAIPTWIKDKFSTAKDWLVTRGGQILSGLWDGIKDWFSTLKDKFVAIPTWIKDKFSTAKDWLVTRGGQILSGLWNGIKDWFGTLKEKFTAVPTWIKDKFSTAKDWLVTRGGQILSGLWNGIKEWFSTLKEKFVAIPTWIKDKFSTAKDWLVTRGGQILSGLWSGIKDWFGTLKEKVTTIPTWIKEKFSTAKDWLFTRGRQILSGLWSGISDWFGTLKEKFTKVPDWIKGKFENASNWLFSAGKHILSGLWSGIKEWYSTLKERFSAIPTWIKDKFSNSVDWLSNAGSNILKGLLRGVKNWWTNITSWFNEVPGKIKAVFSNAVNWLFTAGKDTISGLWDGLKYIWTNGTWTVLSWLKDIPTSIKNIFTYASSWLWNAGWNIISGFWNGLKERWSYVTGWVSNIGQWIADHKGPEAYDKALLVPAGNWIMEGLEEGLQNQFQNVMKQVQSFGPQMEKAFVAPQLSISRVDTPVVTQNPASQSISSTPATEERVSNPYISQESSDINQRPIMYVGTLVADKQSLRELKKKLDIVETEQSRYR